MHILKLNIPLWAFGLDINIDGQMQHDHTGSDHKASHWLHTNSQVVLTTSLPTYEHCIMSWIHKRNQIGLCHWPIIKCLGFTDQSGYLPNSSTW